MEEKWDAEIWEMGDLEFWGPWILVAVLLESQDVMTSSVVDM